MEYELIRSARRSLTVRLKEDGTVLVRAPLLSTRWEIERFLRKHADWIETRREKLRERPAAEKLSREELEDLKKRGRKLFPARVAFYAPLAGVKPGRVAVRSQRSKWGSCSAKGNLNFNCLLLLAPPEALDYVVVHELCHLKEMNHSPRFWAEVKRVLPEAERWRRWLRQNGSSLMARLPD